LFGCYLLQFIHLIIEFTLLKTKHAKQYQFQLRALGRTITCPLREMSKLVAHIVKYLENYFSFTTIAHCMQ